MSNNKTKIVDVMPANARKMVNMPTLPAKSNKIDPLFQIVVELSKLRNEISEYKKDNDLLRTLIMDLAEKLKE